MTSRQEIGSAENFSNVGKDKQLLICSLNKTLTAYILAENFLQVDTADPREGATGLLLPLLLPPASQRVTLFKEAARCTHFHPSKPVQNFPKGKA